MGVFSGNMNSLPGYRSSTVCSTFLLWDLYMEYMQVTEYTYTFNVNRSTSLLSMKWTLP
jgi:hypothetical protein